LWGSGYVDEEDKKKKPRTRRKIRKVRIRRRKRQSRRKMTKKKVRENILFYLVSTPVMFRQKRRSRGRGEGR
jgi:hypothetical protein